MFIVNILQVNLMKEIPILFRLCYNKPAHNLLLIKNQVLFNNSRAGKPFKNPSVRKGYKMKGWQFTYTHEPLKLVEQPDPVAKPGYVVLDVKAAGLCHSDVGALEDEGWLEIITKRPVIMGHEMAGVISALGEGVTGFKVGDRVGVCPVSKTGEAPGYARDGGYATKTTAPAVDLVPIPEGVNFAQAAAGTDAGMTSYHALFVTGRAKPGMKVGIIGVGGLGMMATRAAVIHGCEVYVTDVSPVARELGLEMGAKEAFSSVMDLKDKNCELIIDYAGFGTTTAEAIEAVGFKGRVVIVGMGRLEAKINTLSMILKQVEVAGSNGGDVDDIALFYKHVASGQLKPLITEIGFEDIWDGIGKLKRGEVKGRLVAAV